MPEFVLDERLDRDCFVLFQQPGFHYLLHRNAEVSWFILVPHTNQTEFHLLSMAHQRKILMQVNRLAEFAQRFFKVDKINIATIGNVVSQLHIHVIGRHREDAYWPDVVWGQNYQKTYSSEQRAEIGQQFKAFLE